MIKPTDDFKSQDKFRKLLKAAEEVKVITKEEHDRNCDAPRFQREDIANKVLVLLSEEGYFKKQIIISPNREITPDEKAEIEERMNQARKERNLIRQLRNRG